MHAVFKVLLPIPEIGAQPGDYLYAEPGDPDLPLTLNRHFDRNYLPIVLDSERLTQVSFSCEDPSQTQLQLELPPTASEIVDHPARRRWSKKDRRLKLVS